LIQEQENSINLIPYLALEEKEVELEITIPPHEETMRARGRVVWYEFCSREAADLCRVGIFFKDIEVEARERWEAFVREAASGTGRLWHYIQIVGSLTLYSLRSSECPDQSPYKSLRFFDDSHVVL
jgi:hypothetical protein